MKTMTENPVKSWKSQPYVWMLILIPFTAVIMGIIMINLAIKTDSGLVVDDYYKKGKQINQVIGRDQAASLLALNADIQFDAESNTVQVRLSANSELPSNQSVTLGFFHATRPGMDQGQTLKRIGDQLYAAQFESMSPGRWKVQLATDEWRLTGSLHRPGGNSLQLVAMTAN